MFVNTEMYCRHWSPYNIPLGSGLCCRSYINACSKRLLHNTLLLMVDYIYTWDSEIDILWLKITRKCYEQIFMRSKMEYMHVSSTTTKHLIQRTWTTNLYTESNRRGQSLCTATRRPILETKCSSSQQWE